VVRRGQDALTAVGMPEFYRRAVSIPIAHGTNDGAFRQYIMGIKFLHHLGEISAGYQEGWEDGYTKGRWSAGALRARDCIANDLADLPADEALGF